MNTANTRSNSLTAYCGVVTPELQPPVQRATNPSNRFECPRCGTRYTRAKTVQDAFPACVRKYGNPNGARWNDHPSCWNTRVEPPRGVRLWGRKSKKLRTRAESTAEVKVNPSEPITLDDTPIPEWLEAQFKVESIEEGELPVPAYRPVTVSPGDLDLYRDTESIAREVYATPTPAYNLPGIDPEPFATSSYGYR